MPRKLVKNRNQLFRAVLTYCAIFLAASANRDASGRHQNPSMSRFSSMSHLSPCINFLFSFSPRYLYQDKGLKMPFEKITQLRLERQRVKELENRLKEEERARRAELARRKEINKKREEENARRGEVVQVVSDIQLPISTTRRLSLVLFFVQIRNTNKIKRMKKKQLKLIQKRDTTMV